MSYHIRRLVRADAEVYRAFRLYTLERFPEAFTSHAAEDRAKPLAWYAERLAPATNVRQFVLGAFAADRLVGAAGLTAATRRNEAHKAEIFGVAVHEDWQGQGVGEALLKAIIKDARALRGLRQLSLSVTDADSAAVRLYQRLGFETFGVEPRAAIVNGRDIDKRLMLLRLA
jgi:ribosomal protein S18 acetylase RimI-like enzyme